MSDCAACFIAAASPSSRLVNRRCRACHVRSTAQLLSHQRDAVYSTLPAHELVAFVADVWAEVARRRIAARREAMHAETIWAHAEDDPS